MMKIKLSFVLLFSYLFLIPISLSIAQELTPEQIYEKVNDCVVVILSYDFNGKLMKQGSGVVLSDKGWVVTNYHVFAECEKMEVKHNDKIIKYTDIIGVDVEKDILILKIEDNTFPSIEIGNSDNLKIGQRVYAIGSPLGLENSLSEGIISGLRNIDEKNKNYIQITAGISPGSSGGAIINSNGELIGISTLTLKGGQNLNFAIPVNDILLVSISSYNGKNYIEAYNNFYKGYNAYKSGYFKESILYFSQFLEIYPNNDNAYNNRGLAYYYLLKYTLAISDFTKAIEINPYLYEAFSNRGNAYFHLQEYSKAISDCNKAIDINPNYSMAYYHRGNSYFNKHDYSKAILDYSTAIDLNPFFVEAYSNRGEAHIQSKEYSKAILDCNKAIEINPNYTMAYYNRGNAYFVLSEYSKAILDYTKSIELNSRFTKAYYLRGSAFNILGNNIRACEDYSKAYSLGMINAKELIEQYCK